PDNLARPLRVRNSADDADQAAGFVSATAATGDSQKPPGAAGRNPLLEGVCQSLHRHQRCARRCPWRKSWSVLHTLAALLPRTSRLPAQSADMDAFLRSFSRLFPCPHCSEEFQATLPIRDGRA
uniref:Sulfhydryl oxidase n=1 Tax=Macrostomum lignano TaxID=282301 RepID=A0A1I8FPF5_9PLAT